MANVALDSTYILGQVSKRGWVGMIRKDHGFTLLEVLVVIVILGLIGVFVYSGAMASLRASTKGRRRAQALAGLQMATEELSALEAAQLRERAGTEWCTDIPIEPPPYLARYRIEGITSDSLNDLYRVTVEVRLDDDPVVSNSIILYRPE